MEWIGKLGIYSLKVKMRLGWNVKEWNLA